MKSFQVGEDQVVLSPNSNGIGATVHLVIQGEDIQSWNFHWRAKAETKYLEQLRDLLARHLVVVSTEIVELGGSDEN